MMGSQPLSALPALGSEVTSGQQRAKNTYNLNNTTQNWSCTINILIQRDHQMIRFYCELKRQ